MTDPLQRLSQVNGSACPLAGTGCTGMGFARSPGSRDTPEGAAPLPHATSAFDEEATVGGAPDRRRGSLASPLPSVTFLPPRSRGSGRDLRGPPIGPRRPKFIGRCSTLLTLAPPFPALRSLPSEPRVLERTRCRTSSPGVVQRSPLHRPRAECPRPARHLRGIAPASLPRLRDGNATSHPRAVLVVFHHLDGSGTLRSCPGIAPDCRSWGSPRFLRPESRNPRCARSALRSLPSAGSGRGRGRTSLRCGPASPRADHRWPYRVHRRPCPLALSRHSATQSLPSLRRVANATLRGAGASGPCSADGSVAARAVASIRGPVLPWA